ncbi:MAG TPA: precorrin-2 C(20)-methyltransferase [Stellaceae bacterium]|jgi:precorrin-2/cobalt-factor-2 C20-methyltransferase|nr:precorrin-2 C(20)-methyltransferase [Stellaceae bacterium]
MSGRLVGLGVGPGDPELLTLKALRRLREAAVVAYPAPEGGASFARRIVARWLSPAQREIVIAVPMESARFPAQAVYDRAAAELAAELEAGRDVAVLCQGDPFFYGSFMYLFARLAGRFPVEIVPGVASLAAAAAAAQWPLASRMDCLSVLPASLPEPVLLCRLAEADAVAIIKLGRHFAKVRAVLERLGLAEAARYVEHASLPDERVLPLAAVKDEEVPYFSMILLHRRGAALG